VIPPNDTDSKLMVRITVNISN